MLERQSAGELPAKHHIQLRGPDGALRVEECLTREGFAGAYTLMYHLHRPHPSDRVAAAHGWPAPVEAGAERHLSRRHLWSGQLGSGGAPVDARRPLLFNDDVVIGVAKPDAPDPVYVVHAEADQLIYVHAGGGVLRTQLGDLRFGPMDYVFVPKGMIHRFIPDAGVPQHWLTLEGRSIGLLKQWRNDVGQLRMDAPYCHRDFRRVQFVGPLDEGIRDLVVLRGGRWHGYRLERSPLDVVGWDGAVYPWAFPILAFQPRVSSVHLPPDWHGTFSTPGALICSFVPRLVDFHPQAIPCPYPHSSVDCDEVLFYCQGNFTSRKGVGPGSLSLHPYGIPHGPHPGSYEGSIGSVRTDELAVMVDTFKPLRMTQHAIDVEDAGYHDSFDG
jgi:homogentisate 1,2-dioxygenase